MLGLALETSWLLGSKHDWVRYAKLACNYLGKTKFYAEYGSMDILYSLSRFVPLSPTFCPTQGYPPRFLAFTFMYAVPIEFHERFHQGPLHMHFSTCF